MANVRKIKSSSITVFPTTKRQKGNRSSKLLTESNLVNIINSLLDVESFVITDNITSNDSSIEFNILGYYFKISKISDILAEVNPTNLTHSIYANIYFMRSGDYKELYGTDVQDPVDSTQYYYDGIYFTENEPDMSASGSLKILSRQLQGSLNNSWYIPYESKIRYMQRSFGNIDCGRI